jgi:hypothetical protein
MSDFEAALERLLTDPSFAVELARDPKAALSGYLLDPAELEVLQSQVATDDLAGLAAVEDRTTKSSTFGMFSSLGEWAEFGTATSTGSAAGAAAQLAGGLGAEPATAAQPLGFAPDAWGTAVDSGGAGGSALMPSGDVGFAQAGFGDAGFGDTLDDLPATSGMGDAPRSGLGDPGPRGTAGVAEEREIAPPKWYHNQVDADGDGQHDKATYRGREDGGVDILVDLNGDGRTDFIGHDLDLDNRVDSAEYDKNFDGVFEKKMYDDNGDGWLDRTVWRD